MKILSISRGISLLVIGESVSLSFSFSTSASITTKAPSTRAFLTSHPTTNQWRREQSSALYGNLDHNNDADETQPQFMEQLTKGISTLILASALLFNVNASPTSPLSFQPPAAVAADGAAIAGCLFQKCKLPLAKCIANPKCLANVICINTCNDVADETGCQIKCGDIFENKVVGEFNKCAVSDMTCVPQKPDDGSYPVPKPELLVQKFDTSLFNGRWYITAGQNKLFDVFPCQVHFFTESAPGKFFGKLNWRIEEPDGEFFTRDAIQRFVQDPKQPGHLINHDNEYLHYEDDWYILDYEPDNSKTGTPAFALVYYRGSNDAWIGYGGAVVYTREAKLPPSLIPRLREGVKKINYDFDRDFDITDNSCRANLNTEETLLLREKFAGKVALQTESQLQQQSVLVRGNAVNAVKAQKIYLGGELGQAEKALEELVNKAEEFEKELVGEAAQFEKELVGGASKK